MIRTTSMRTAVLCLALLTAACATSGDDAPAPDVAALPSASMVSAIRAAGKAADDELDVRPLRDPQVEDLRTRASQHESRGEFREAAALLDEALRVQEADPAVLQERAEVALLLGDADAATGYARRAIALGAGVGPLCRRHWMTIEQVARTRVGAGDNARAAQAKSELETAQREGEACTVAAPARY